ncbi:MAG: DUF3108 domain-containing protein [Pyrinomonadaceae bacterium]
MKRPLIALATLLLTLALSAPLLAQRQAETVATPFSLSPYRVGERLTYNVSFSNFISAAHVELFVAGRGNFFGREGLQIRAHVETTGIVNVALYAVNNDYISYVDPASGLPFRTQQVVREAGRASDSEREYNQPAGTSAIPAKVKAVGITGTYDLLSALYRLRALPLTEGGVYHLSVSNDPETYDVELKVTGREMVKTNVGSFSTIVTQVRVPSNSSANNYHIRIYFSDDERHVPILILAHHSAGEIRAELAGSELPSGARPTPTPAIPSRTVIVPNRANPLATSTPPVAQPTPTPPPAANGDGSAGADLPAGVPFKVGEQLNFNVFLGNMPQPVGIASFQVRTRAKFFNRDGLLITAKGQTTAALQKIFFASDQINSYLDPDTLLPFRTEIMQQENRRRSNQTFSFDQDRGGVVTDTGTRIEIPVGTHDFLSIFYALRSFNLTPPKRNAVSLLAHNRARTLFLTSLRREVIELGGQKISAIQLSVTTDDAQPDKYGLRLWVSDDRRRLPLRIVATTEIGPVRADLAIIPLDKQ